MNKVSVNWEAKEPHCLIKNFLSLSSIHMQTHSPLLSPLPFPILKAHPLTTLHFLYLAVLLLLCPSYLSSIVSIKIWWNFFSLQSLFSWTLSLPPSSPWLCSLLKSLSPSLSQSDHEWMRHGCANACSLPICLGAFVCQSESGGKPLH